MNFDLASACAVELVCFHEGWILYDEVGMLYARVADSAIVEALLPEHAGIDLRGG